MRKMHQPNGFSLIELVIVLTVIGILTAVAVGRFVELKTDSQISGLVTEANRLNRLALVAQQLNGSLPSNVNGGIVPTELSSVLGPNVFQGPNAVGAS